MEVTTKAEAERLADEMPGTWKHRRRGAYRVVPLNAQRPKRVSHATTKAREAEGWIIARRTTKPWMLVAPAAAQTRNTYRDIFGAILDYAVRRRWLPTNPLDEVKRTSKRHERERILRRDDFYDPTKSTGCSSTRRASSRKPSGCSARTPACAYRARPKASRGARSTSRPG